MNRLKCAVVWLGLVLAVPLGTRAESDWFNAGWGGRSETPHPAVARITAAEQQGSSQGSGTLVAHHEQFGLVLTNWHVIRDAAGPVLVQFPDGFTSGARVLKVDEDWDLAALLIWKPPVEPVRLASTAPQLGEPLTIAGYGSGTYRSLTGRCTQYVSPAISLPYEMLEVNVEARNGDSGGPIFNQQGELAAVLFGAADGNTTGSYCGRVRQFLTGVLPEPQAATPDSLLAGTPGSEPLLPLTPQRPASASRDYPPAVAHVPRPAAGDPRTTGDMAPPSAEAANNPYPGGGWPNGSRWRDGSNWSGSSVPNDPAPHTVGRPYAPPVRDTAAAASGESVALRDLIGETLFEQAKTLLAIIGIAALVMGLKSKPKN